MPPLTEEEGQIVEKKMEVRTRIQKWVEHIYRSERRPPVQNEQEYSIMVNYLFIESENETLEEHQAILNELQFGGAGSKCYQNLMKRWFENP